MNALLRHRVWRAAGAQLARLALLLLIVAACGVGTSAAAIAIQAQRDDMRSADLLLVIAPDIPPTSLIEHGIDLYRRGYGGHIVLSGPGRGRAYAALVGRGLPAEALISGAGDRSLGDALATSWQGGARSLLVVSAPADQLLSLKIARDQGMHAYGSPVPAAPLGLLDTLRAALGYWRYALLGDA
ncbi:hypothetical protein K2Z83_22130 [Oscillochloris sp. ZM17-4]|uniref:hypothetical protein n=1 Tax=Oscillochloris sp. ZM17-4 TaxID=2866714 RepID=UPI001C7314C5|nr:hypothetical protein [Oscillochloris sp. ZM17-4]MBX0330365.1 hypothetical protein [Oscillochloris sp. ZM17-4]